MSTFAEFAITQEEDLKLKLTGLLHEVRDFKPAAKDTDTLMLLTALQASIVCLVTQAGENVALLKAATRNNEFAHISAPAADHQRLAANDPTEETEEAHEATLPADHNRTLSVHELMQLELIS